MIQATMKNVLAVKGIKASELSEILGCSFPTAQKKIKDPLAFTVADLSRLYLFGKINIDDLTDAVRLVIVRGGA